MAGPGRRGRGAVAAFLACGVALGTSLLVAGSARAEPENDRLPSAEDSVLTVDVAEGDTRLGLFAAEDAGQVVDPEWGVCEPDDEGGCAFVVPGTIPTFGADGETPERRFYVREVDADSDAPAVGANAVCVDAAEESVPVEHDRAGFSLDVPTGATISCVDAGDDDPSLTVDSAWEINGDPFAQGDQPEGFEARLLVSDPGGGDLTEQPWGSGRGGYAAGEDVTVDAAVTVPDFCVVERRQVTGINEELAAVDVPHDITVGPDGTHATVTTTVACEKPEGETLTVDSVWEINGETYHHGDQPSDFQAQLTLSGPGGDIASDQAWGAGRGGYAAGEDVTVDAAVTVPEECVVERRQVTGINEELAAVDVPHDITVGPDGTHATVTSTVTCEGEGTLTLENSVDNDHGGTARSDDWTLSADGPSPIVGTSGSDEVTEAQVAPGGYVLWESGGPDGYESSDWSCRWDGKGKPEVGAQIDIRAGDVVTCSITNNDVDRSDPTPSPSPTPDAAPGPSGTLPVTGGALIGLASTALVLIGGGATLWWRTRRSRPKATDGW